MTTVIFSLSLSLSFQTWSCEFCGNKNVLSQSELKMGRSPLWTPPGRDVLYVDEEIDADYVNLEDMLVVFCVDISGSMSVTSEVTCPLA